MTKEEILSKVDHTVLNVDATEADIKTLCKDAIKYNTATVCVSPCFVKLAAKLLEGFNPMVCTVIGFPNGSSTTSVKCYEAEDAVKNGADEIDMVINIGWLKDKKYELILREINSIKASIGEKTLKVIVETCLLTNEEKAEICKVVSESEADFIKTSTGFSTGGATIEDIEIFVNNISNNTKIKAAGGINSFKDAEDFINAGASRLGTSRLVRLLKENDSNENVPDSSY